MSVWGVGAFDNDAARAWMALLGAYDAPAFIAEAFDAVLDAGDDPLDAQEAAEAIVAAMVVARWLEGRHGPHAAVLPAGVWAELEPCRPTPALLKRAAQAVDRVVVQISRLPVVWTRREARAQWLEEMLRLGEWLLRQGR